ncbi:MAG TPA: hypothetical protein VGE77_07985 [Nocardioides sp.]
MSRRSTFVGAIAAVVTLGAGLTACGGRTDLGAVHAIEPAAVEGVASAVRVPGGELRVEVTSLLDEDPGRPYGDGAEGEEDATAPFVAVAWHPEFPAGGASTLAAAMGTTEVAAVVAGERAVISDPDAMVDENGLPVSGGAVLEVPQGYDVADLRVEVVVDGVTQVLDPWAGQVEAGDAEMLYADVPTRWDPRPCAELEIRPPLRTFPGDGVLCDVGTVVTSPWRSDLGWAGAGETWWTVYLGTHLTLSDLGAADDPDGDEPWDAGPLLTHEVTLDGEAPAAEAPGAQGATTPIASDSQTYGYYTFAGPAEPPAAADGATFRIRQTYAVLAANDAPAPPAEEAVVDVTIPVGPAVPVTAEGDR